MSEDLKARLRNSAVDLDADGWDESAAHCREAADRIERLEEALKPFAMFALEGKRGGDFIICKGLFSDMKGWDDSPPRECHLHKDDFLRARTALKETLTPAAPSPPADEYTRPGC